jgi:hypothetical protein
MDQVHDSKQQFFISYAGKDRAVAQRLKADLERHGLQVWLDIGGIAPGERWDDCIRREIRKSLAVLYLASPDSRSSPNVFHEIGLAKMYGCCIVPLWIAGAKWADVAIFGFYPVEYIDLRSVYYADGLVLLVKYLRNLLVGSPGPINPPAPKPEESSMSEKIRKWFLGLFQHDKTNGRGGEPPSPPGPRLRNPYKGLYAFEYGDAGDFFGREHLVGEMVQEVKHIFNEERHDSQASRCMLVIGASGAGKSSVVMAGLLPTLQRCQDIPEVKRWLFLEPVSPGEHPIYRLIHALKRPYLNKMQAGDAPLVRCPTTSVQQELEDPSARGLHTLLQSLTPDVHDRVVLVIDQLEELFAPAVDPAERELFINLLFATATEPYSRVLIIVTLRADFYDYVLKYPRLFSVVKSHKIDVPPMNSQELRDVIEKPAQLPDVKVTFDADLIGDLIFDMRERPGALPLLQFVLEKLFEQREGHNLTRRSYEALGGLQGAIDRHADEVFDNLPSEGHREYTRRLFTHHLIHIMESSQELARLEAGEEIIRRRATRGELQLDEPQNAVARQTIDAFTQARLLTARNATGLSTRLEDSTYEISHEVLINAWKRLAKWIEDDRQDIYLGQRLRSHAAQWQRETNRRKKQESLVERRELQQLQAYGRRQDLNAQERQFLKYNEHYYLWRRVQYVALWLVLLVIFVPLSQFALSKIFPDPSIVTTTNDGGPGSLRQAIANMRPGMKITFAAGLNGTIHLTADLSIDKNITISGPEDDAIKISSDNTGKSIGILPDGNVTFNNIMFASSYTHKKSLIMNDGNLTLNNCQVTDNSSYGNGGAISNGEVIFNGETINNSKASLILNGTTLSNNRDSGDGGAIYNVFGSVNVVNGSKIIGNRAYSNGGGIYSLGGRIEISDSQFISNETADAAAQNNYGGGLDVVDGLLFMSDVQVSKNHAQAYGGGLAIQGSEAVISDTIIDHNSADKMGGGIIVAINTNDNLFGLATLNNIAITNTPHTLSYISQNTSGDRQTNDIAGERMPTGSVLQIASVSQIATAGNPSPNNPPQLNNRIFAGFANINEFCQHHDASYGLISPNVTISCYTLQNKPVGSFTGQQICQEQKHAVVDRLVDYPGPFTLQCYKNVRYLGPIGNNPVDFARVCSSDGQGAGLYDNQSERTTAYDWRCQPKQAGILPRSLSVARACVMKYRVASAFDRLVDYNKPDGWECWAPV